MVDIRRNVMNQFAKQGVGKVKESLGIEGSDSTGSNRDSNQTPINWHDFNYPPLIRLIHYSTVELS